MFADARGEAVEIEGPMGLDEDAIDRARDLAILAMTRRKVPYRLIARYFNTTKSQIHKFVKAIPKEATQHYAAGPLEWLDSA